MNAKPRSLCLLPATLLIALPAFASPAHPSLTKVLHYTKTGYYDAFLAVEACTTALNQLSIKYGFSVVHSKDPKVLLDLKQYDLVIYDNNTDAGGTEKADIAARPAVMDYMNHGGRFLGISWAVEHRAVWGWYDSVLFSGAHHNKWFTDGSYPIYRDTSAASRSNAAISRMWAFAKDSLGIAIDSIRVNSAIWQMDRDPRGLPGVFILQEFPAYLGTDKRESISWTTYLPGGGRMLYSNLGFDGHDWNANDFWLTKATYAYMRFLVGDFDSASVTSIPKIGTRGSRLDVLSEKGQSVRVTDIRGKLVASSTDADLIAKGLKPGIYFITGKKGGVWFSRTLAVP